MRDSTRTALSWVISVSTHLLFVLVASMSFDFFDFEIDAELDVIEFEIKDIVDPNALQVPEPPEQQEPPEESEPPPEEDTQDEQPEPPPEQLPEDPKEEPIAPEPEPPPEQPPPEKKFAEKRSKIAAMVPNNSTWTMMLANERIAKLPFADEATEIMAPLDDFQLLVDDAGFHVWNDFDFIVMGTPDATDPTQAFVAVQYDKKFGHTEMKAGIERACKGKGIALSWREENGATIGDPVNPTYTRKSDKKVVERDNREFVLLPGDKVALYLRTEFIPSVIAGPSKDKTAGNFVANISRMTRFTKNEPRAGIQVVLEDVRAAWHLPSGKGLKKWGLDKLELPNRVEVLWEAAKDPELAIKLEFIDKAHADFVEDYWTKQLQPLLKQERTLWFAIGGMITSTRLDRNKNTITLRNQLSSGQTQALLRLIAGAFGSAMRYTPDDAKAAKERRAAMWEARGQGAKLPSEIGEAEDGGETEGDAEVGAEGDSPEDNDPETNSGDGTDNPGETDAPEKVDPPSGSGSLEGGATDDPKQADPPKSPAPPS